MAASELERLSGPVHPLPVLRRGSEVKVYTGAGWAKGKVNNSTRDCCTVYMTQQRRTTRCHDARNIIPL